MDASAIAKSVNAFNVAAISLAACFAAVGLLIVVLKIFRFKPSWVLGANIVVKAFCIAALAAFALEATVFNFPSYLKYFAGAPTAVKGSSAADPNILLTTDGTRVSVVQNGIRFEGLNRKVTSLFVDIVFENDVETVKMRVTWLDDMMAQEYYKTLYKYRPHDNHALLQSCGKVSNILIVFDDDIIIRGAAVNKPVPFYFSGLRLLAVSLLFFALFAFVNKNLRAKAAYWLFEYGFDPKNKKQNAVYACTVALLILFSWVCVYTSVKDDSDMPGNQQYNKFLVDALIAGRTNLEYGNPEKLLGAPRPYDTGWLSQHGYTSGVDYMWDWAWYKGKYYSYFGVVPAVVLYVPYKMVSGGYLPIHTGVFIFAAIAVILLALLWRYCAEKYMRDIRFAFFTLSFLTLFFASGMFATLRHTHVYSVVQSAGLMFAAAGVLLLLKSVDNEKINHPKLFFACLCFALVFGCRPNMGLVSLVVPVVLWKHRSWKTLLFAMFPYILVALPLCAYNYVRFESIFDFGANYNLTALNMTEYGSSNPIAKLIRVFVSSAYYLFYPNGLSLYFPFVQTSIYPHMAFGVFYYVERGSAIINFPIVFCLFYIFKNIFDKNKPEIFRLLYAFLIIAAAITVINSLVAGFAGRYLLDMATFIILPSLFCAYFWNNGAASVLRSKTRMKVTYALCAISVLTGMFLFVGGTPFIHNDPTLYRYLECSLGILRDI